MAKRNRSKEGVCAYCGSQGQTTEDHIIPRGMFERPYPSYLPVVPACRLCNEEKGIYDDYLRNVFALDLRTVLHPIARKKAEGEAIRSVQRRDSAIGRALIKRGQTTELYTPGDLRLATPVPVDYGRVQQGISWIVRGLHYHEHNGVRLPDNYAITVRREIANRGPAIWLDFLRAGFAAKRLGEGVFVAQFAFADVDPHVGIWGLLFYEALLFIVDTDAPDSLLHSVHQNVPPASRLVLPQK